MKKNIILLLAFFTTFICNAQLPSSSFNQQSSVMDGFYVEEHVPLKRVVPYRYIRQADVMWAKRIWRVIDLREKMNHKLYYPLNPTSDRRSLWDVIKYGAIEEKTITIYSVDNDDKTILDDDRFRVPVKPENGNVSDPEFKKKLLGYFGEYIEKDSLDANDEPVYKDDGSPMPAAPVYEPIRSRDIVRYEIKEDWFFDKQRSVMDVRIIGISPVVYSKNPESGNIEALENKFWLYFPECRYLFQLFSVYNPQNDAAKMSFNDLFEKREFSSFIRKESNVFDRSIDPNWTGLDALLESERIKEEMFEKEHDLWHY